MSPGRRGGRRTRPRKRHAPQHSSQPTSRVAYSETREWLLKTHGPICAYCGVKYSPRSLTLDHVTPRKGQSAYDRRDNLVLACKRCNTAKADKPFLVFLLAQRTRAERLLRLELLRQAADREVARLRLLSALAAVTWIATLLLVGLTDHATMAKVVIGAGWLLLLGALGSGLAGQARVVRGLEQIGSGTTVGPLPSQEISSGTPGTAAGWLVILGLATVGVGVLL